MRLYESGVRKTRWFQDDRYARRVPIRQLNNGDMFRLLSKYGKPHGPRYVIVKEAPDVTLDYNNPGGYFFYCNIVFTEIGKEQRLVLNGGSDSTIVKPIHGSAMVVMAKLDAYTGSVDV